MLHNAHPLTELKTCQEYLNRPTAPAHWWEAPDGHVLGGRDLLRNEQGTWLGLTKQGRIAVLTNFQEDNVQLEARSRGEMVNAYLTQPANSLGSTQDFIESLVEGEGLKGVGGFSLVCGKIGEPLAVISNRTPSVEGITWIANGKDETIGLSNAAFANRSWPKVIRGEELLASAIKANIEAMAPQSSLIEDLFHVLGDDTLPKKPKGMGWDSYVKELRKSVFIPVIGGQGEDDLGAEDLAAATSNQHVTVDDSARKVDTGDGHNDVYGTQKQTVVLVDHQGMVTIVERTLYDENSKEIPTAERDRRFEFFIEGWNEE